jgi:hypothetical protein
MLKAPAECQLEGMRRKLGADGDAETLPQALVTGDPEVDLHAIGRIVEGTSRVFVTQEGEPLHAASIIEVLRDATGREIARRQPVTTAATVGPDQPLRLLKRSIPPAEVAARCAITRAHQLRHTDGLTFDFLFGIAQRIQHAGGLRPVGAGRGGRDAIILERNGHPYRGFLLGQTRGESYRLILLLSSWELSHA